MKISFVMNVRMPTEKAHGYQIAKMCEALALRGARVSLIIPTRKNDVAEDLFSYYGILNNFSVKYTPTFDALAFFRGSRIGFYVQAMSFLLTLRHEAISRDAIIITRNPEIAWWYRRKGYRVFFDAHNFPAHGGWFLKLLLRDISGVIANSRGTARAYRAQGFMDVLVAPNAVDLAQFADVKTEDRSALGLPTGRIAMYVGHLYEWKGVGVVVEAARRSKIKNLNFVFVGGTDADLAHLHSETKNIQNVLLMGRRPHQEVPALIRSADVLLLPNIPSTQESNFYTSPIKMFEYMASGVPIVASSLPSIKEILNDKNAFLVKSKDPEALLCGIEQAFLDDANERSIQAKEDVQQFTWDKRAQKIIVFVGHQ